MPTICYIEGFRFFFFSNEGYEPHHIHIEKENFVCKFWLTDVSLASNFGFRAVDLNKLSKLVMENRNLFLTKWNEYFNR
ncbi:DUF4160 domain-containing protein [Rubrolithibacter danxiaensis]|uniref:DUF4160 domain-containing protein n=1 Tax=Rubrolithibacter danxiaensis TaxID=3390805 RepID=UPI003BF78C5F